MVGDLVASNALTEAVYSMFMFTVMQAPPNKRVCGSGFRHIIDKSASCLGFCCRPDTRMFPGHVKMLDCGQMVPEGDSKWLVKGNTNNIRRVVW